MEEIENQSGCLLMQLTVQTPRVKQDSDGKEEKLTKDASSLTWNRYLSIHHRQGIIPQESLNIFLNAFSADVLNLSLVLTPAN